MKCVKEDISVTFEEILLRIKSCDFREYFLLLTLTLLKCAMLSLAIYLYIFKSNKDILKFLF